jgi:hypothetical protein
VEEPLRFVRGPRSIGWRLLALQTRFRAMAQLGGLGWVVWFHVFLSCFLCKSARDWRSVSVWSATRLCNTDKASINVAAIVLAMGTWCMTFRMSS